MDAPNAPDPPERSPPKAKGVFKGKKSRKRGLAYKSKKGSDNKKSARRPSPPPPQDDTSADTAIRPTAVPSAPRDVDASVTSSSSTKYMTKADLEALLRQRERELVDARAVISKKDKTINSLTNKNNKLLEASQFARSAAHEAKQYAKGVEEDAARSAKMFRDDLAMAEERDRKKEAELKDKEAMWNDEMDRIKDLEQVSYCFNIIQSKKQ